MPDELFDRTSPPAARSTGRARSIIGIILLVLVIAAGIAGWLAWQGKIRIGADALGEQRTASLAQSIATPPPSAAALPAQPALPPAEAAAASGFDQRLAALEQRLARLDLQAAAASGNAARAEGLLIAFASRRALERGAPLGYLEDQLKLRFADAQPNAVDTVLAAARQPSSIEQLVGQLDALGPTLADAPKDEGGWSRLQRGLSDLFVIRRDTAQSVRPTERLDRAKLLLRNGKVEQAAAEVARLPGAAAAQDWIAAAYRYAAAERALDLIESTAILEPRRLQDGSGQRIEQPSPLAQPISAENLLL